MPNVIVHAHEPFSGVDLTEENGYAGAPDAFLGFAFLGETLHQEWTQDPQTEEIGAFGSVKTAGLRTKRTVGDLRGELRLDAKVSHFLLGNGFGEEKLLPDVWVDNAAAVGANTHVYLFNATRPSLRIRSHK